MSFGAKLGSLLDVIAALMGQQKNSRIINKIRYREALSNESNLERRGCHALGGVLITASAV